MQRVRTAVALLGLVPAACGIEQASADPEDGGIGVDRPTDTDAMPADDDDAATSGEDVVDGSGDETTTGSACLGAHNACGGCEDLPGEPGQTCNGCDELEWACDGPDAVVCAGFDADATEYFPDADEDGFGDGEGLRTCEDPGPGWATNDNDCDDDDPDVNPGALEGCNGIDDDCDLQTDEAPDNTLCDDVCCDFAQVCDGEACVDKCPMGELCGDDLDVCCGMGEQCFAGACLMPDTPCEYDENCAIDEICAPGLGMCVPQDIVPQCELPPPPAGVFDPVEACHWESTGLVDAARDDIVATPIVINLSDDNADGFTNREDIPDIVFVSYDYEGAGCCNQAGTIRIVSGECNDDGSMTTLGSINSPAVTNDVGLAAGDLTGDGVAEIVGVRRGANVQGTVAFTRTSDDASTWDVLWQNDTYPIWNVHTRGGPTISLYELSGDGVPDVVIGNVVLDGTDGSLLWDGLVTGGAGVGVGNNGFLGPASTVADLDQDGMGEVIAGNTVYEHDGSVKWTYDYSTSNSSCGGQLPCDGFNAIANFDGDDAGEVVIVRLGEVFLIDDDGTLIDQMQLPIINCGNNEAGPPTIADFDGDGLPEVGTASADYYVVVDFQCTGPGMPDLNCTEENILWQVPNDDCSSRVTASSVFDFEGDEQAEVIYADETTFRIFDGTTGTILYEDATHRSHTRIEMPVIADVDNDGAAEVIIPENDWNGGDGGLNVFADASDNWVRTRRVWNQHGYYITHITEDGVVPAVPETNWLNERFNNFRQNVQPDGLFHAPNATVVGSLCGLSSAGMGMYSVDLSVVVRNDGTLPVPAGTPVHLQIEPDPIPLFDTMTSIDLLPGQVEIFNLVLPVPMDAPDPPFTVTAIIDPADELEECIEDDNARQALCALPG